MRNPPQPNTVQSPEEILSAWKENRSELVKLLVGMNDSVFQAKPESGWSPSELAEHLYLSQWNLARSIPIVLGKKFGIDTSELNQESRYETMFKLVSKARGAKNPVEVGPKGGMDKETALASLNKAEEKLMKSAAGQSVERLQSRGMEHPFFGPISLLDWLWVMTNHEFAHVNTLKEKVHA